MFLGQDHSLYTAETITNSINSGISRQEGWRALFKGLGPNLAGVVPARYVNLAF